MKITEQNSATKYALRFGVGYHKTIYPMDLFAWQQLRGLAGMNGCWLPDCPVSLQGEAALRLADALFDGLEDVPDHDALKVKREIVEFPDGHEAEGFANDTDISPLEWFSYDGGQEWLRGFILCLYRHRGFTIQEGQ